MSDAIPSPRNKLWTSPLRDLLRGRVTGRLDWKSRLAAVGLPAPSTELIVRVVKLTRLWRLEKAAVADELIAHFLDGVAAGTSALELIDRFGDQRIAARLIRRAKKRNRWMPWHILVGTVKTFGILLGIYGLLLIRFCVERPSPKVDYVAQLNAPVAASPVSDRAWSIYRRAIIAASDGVKDGTLVFSKALNWDRDKPPWDERLTWLRQHAPAIDLVRQGSQKPVMGFILDDAATLDDPKSGPCNPEHHLAFDQGVFDPSRDAHDRDIDKVLEILDLDTACAIRSGDGTTAEADLTSALSFARQLQGDPWSPGRAWIDRAIMWRMQWILSNYGSVLNDSQYLRIAREISGPKVASDLFTDKSRYYVADEMQQIFTDDGNGDGHLTLMGLGKLQKFLANQVSNYPQAANLYSIAAPIPLVTPSRAQLQALFDDRLNWDQTCAKVPLRSIDLKSVRTCQDDLADTPLKMIRFGPWALAFREHWDLARLGDCEEYLGDRDGMLIGIALERFRRQHNTLPKRLNELVPAFMSEIPVDRISGDPIKYRVISGKPVVYSVGLDGIDDGGTPPKDPANSYHCPAADWVGNPADVDRHDPRRGDWIVYPAIPKFIE